MRRYLNGVKVKLWLQKDGILVEFVFVPSSEYDSLTLKKLPLELPLKVSIC